MANRSQWLIRGLIASGLGLSLSACGGNGSSSSSAITTPVTASAAQEDKFGTVFGADFRMSANSEPATVNTTDIVAVSLTNEPIPIT